MIRTIPLLKLLPSPRNVRRATDEQADLQLKADIEARGLLQNLVVAPAKMGKGRYTVEAGGRRLRSLQALAEDGKLPPGHEVCCLVLGGGVAAAREASLAENFQRLSMNPADECLAFQQLIEAGSDVDGIARRFGLTVRFVEGRLRLAGLAPVVFEALGAGEITLDVAKAYAATADRERQAYVFEQVSRSYMSSHPDSIRRMMTQATVSSSDRRARFVGEEAYVAAGGRIERDLFSDEGTERWLDVALLERLASDKMEALAAETAAAEGLAFVRPGLESWITYADTEGLRAVELECPTPSEAEQAEVEAMEDEIQDLVRGLEDEQADEAARTAAEARIHELDQRIDSIVNRPPVVPEELKGRVGTFLLLDQEGRPKLETRYYVKAGDEAEGAEPADGGTGAGAGEGASSRSAPSEPAPKAAALSQALVDELSMQRRDILAVHVAADPGLALDLVLFLMVDRDVRYSYGRSGSSLMAMPPSDPVIGFRTPGARATLAIAERTEALDRTWTEAADQAARFDAFRALSDEARAAWLGHAVARTLEASLNHAGGRACSFHDHLGQLLGIDVAQWWRPTGSNYFDRVPKSVTLAAIEEVGGPAFAARHAKAKKAELSETAERLFAGELIVEAEVKAAALAWVPEPMRFAAPTAEPEVEALNGGEQPEPAVPAVAAANPPDVSAEDDTPPWEELPSKKAPGDTGGAPDQARAEESGGCAGEVEHGESEEPLVEAA